MIRLNIFYSEGDMQASSVVSISTSQTMIPSLTPSRVMTGRLPRVAEICIARVGSEKDDRFLLDNGSTTVSSFMSIKSCTMLGEVQVGKVVWCVFVLGWRCWTSCRLADALFAAGLSVTVGHNVTAVVPRLFLFDVQVSHPESEYLPGDKLRLHPERRHLHLTTKPILGVQPGGRHLPADWLDDGSQAWEDWKLAARLLFKIMDMVDLQARPANF